MFVCSSNPCANRCFAYWGLNSTAATAGKLCRWQEAVGGALGYSTTCTGAKGTATINTPGSTQVRVFEKRWQRPPFASSGYPLLNLFT